MPLPPFVGMPAILPFLGDVLAEERSGVKQPSTRGESQHFSMSTSFFSNRRFHYIGRKLPISTSQGLGLVGGNPHYGTSQGG